MKALDKSRKEMFKFCVDEHYVGLRTVGAFVVFFFDSR